VQKGQVGHGGAVGERRSTAGHGVFGFGEAVKVRSGSLRRGEFWLEVLQRIGEERPFEVWTGEVWSAEARKEIMKKLIAGLLFVPAVAQAEFMSGNNLLSDMNGSNMRQMLALGYVMGVTDTFTTVTVCPPSGITSGQVQDIIKKHLEDNPASRHYTADSIIRNKLEAIWPCSRGRGT
jgi:hypothetical protein